MLSASMESRLLVELLADIEETLTDDNDIQQYHASFADCNNKDNVGGAVNGSLVDYFSSANDESYHCEGSDSGASSVGYIDMHQSGGESISQQHSRSKRHQVKSACVNCRKSCKKCEEQRPCQRCIRLGIADQCIDWVRKPRERGYKRGPYNKKNSKKEQKPYDGFHQHPDDCGIIDTYFWSDSAISPCEYAINSGKEELLEKNYDDENSHYDDFVVKYDDNDDDNRTKIISDKNEEGNSDNLQKQLNQDKRRMQQRQREISSVRQQSFYSRGFWETDFTQL